MRGALRSLPVLAALIALAAPSAANAAAAGGSASCTIPFDIAHRQQLGEMAFVPGTYKLTVLDTSELNCGEASNELRAALRAPGAELPEGWRVDPSTNTLSRGDGTDAVRIESAPDDVVMSGDGT